MTASRVEKRWLGRGVFHRAHQGGAKEAPSNTLHAMERAAALGVDGLDFDVHLSRDGRVVSIHDKTLERTTNGTGLVSDHAADELGALDAAHWWVRGEVDNHDPATPEAAYELRGEAAKNADLGVPVLDDVLNRCGHLPMTIEVKDEKAAWPLVAVLGAHNIPLQNLIVTSFSDVVESTSCTAALSTCRWLRPAVGRSLSTFATGCTCRCRPEGRMWHFRCRTAVPSVKSRRFRVSCVLSSLSGGVSG